MEKMETKIYEENSKITGRRTGIELLKIFSMLLIVIYHVTYTLQDNGPALKYSDYIINLRQPTTNWEFIILKLFLYLGILGNSIFFICSSWFLLKCDCVRRGKWLLMLLEIWFVSVLILVIALISGESISLKLIIKSIFPTTFSNNWYLTCYLLFYPISPMLNKIIINMEQKALFKISGALMILYLGIGFIIKNSFFGNRLIFWIAIYFVMAYIQLYLNELICRVKYNIILMIIGLTGYIGMALITNFMGLSVPFFENRTWYWIENNNPFIWMLAFALFNLVRRSHFQNHIINSISSLSLLIYVIHENIILKTYYRTYMWHCLYKCFGHEKIVCQVLGSAMLIFAFSIVCAVLYKITLKKFVENLCVKLLFYVEKIYMRIENYALKLH